MIKIIGNRTLCCPIQSVNIPMINKLDSRYTVVQFCQSLIIIIMDRIVLYSVTLPIIINFLITYIVVIASYNKSNLPHSHNYL